MDHFRLFRICSATAAAVYMLFYIFITADWIGQIYWEPTMAYEEYQFIDILVNMYLAYNIIFNLHIIPVNMMILIKEFSLEVAHPMLNQDEGDNLDVEDIIEAVEPITWWDWIIKGMLPDQQLPSVSKVRDKAQSGQPVRG